MQVIYNSLVRGPNPLHVLTLAFSLLLVSSDSLPVTLSGNAVAYRGDVMTGLSAAIQHQSSRSEMAGGRLQLSQGKAAVSLKLKSQRHWWMGLVAMVVPLWTLLLQTLGALK